MSNDIDKIAPPALPLAPEAYQRPYTDQSNNILRLFFNRLIGLLNKLLSQDNGGKFLYFPRGLFYDTTLQEAAAINTAYVVTFNNTYIGEGVTLVDNSKITVGSAGVYNFQFSAQGDKHGGVTETLWLWIRKNGTDVDNSTREYGIARPTNVMWNFNIDMETGDYIEMIWAVDNTDLDLHAYPAATPHPGIPSAVMAVSFVSNH